MKKILITCCIFFSITGLENTKAQTSPVAEILQGIYKNYDSVKYLSFDVSFDYGSDTLLGKFDKEQLSATYTLAGNKAKYSIGDIDFMQNDSFFIAVYNKDKLIMVDEPKDINVGSQLPMRQQIDSLLSIFAEDYSISTFDQSPGVGVIQLLRADSLAQFDKFSISYDKQNKMLYQLYYEYKEPADLDSAVLAVIRLAPGAADSIPMQKKRFAINFLNYRFDNYNDEVYDENNYIWFENGLCRPAAKYDGFKIYYTKPSRTIYEENDH